MSFELEELRKAHPLHTSAQGEAMQAFDTKRRVQREMEAGIVKFNHKPKDGLAYLVSLPSRPLRLLPLVTSFSSKVSDARVDKRDRDVL